MFVDCFQLVYHGLQLVAFTMMATVFMRLKLFWTPHMCLLTSLIASKKVYDALSTRNVGQMPDVMAALPNIGGAICSTPQSLADAHY